MQQTATDWYAITNAPDVPSPALLVYPDRVRANSQQTIRLAGGPERLCPHVKTHKMRAVTDLLLDAGIRQFKCATIKEARMLAEAVAERTGGRHSGRAPGGAGFDVLLAYPLVGPTVDQFAALRIEFPDVRFAGLVDHERAAQALSNTFSTNPLDVLIDLNVGMNRTGIAPEKAVMLAQLCRELPGLRMIGLHAYDGHIRATDVAQRTQQTDATFAAAKQVRSQLTIETGAPVTLVMGGSPSFALHAQQADVLVSPGTFVFWDAGYAATLPDLPLEPAAVLLTRVISVIDEQTICLDLGHKAVAAENPLPRVVFLNQPDATPIGQSEEHLVVSVPNATQHTPGDVWYGVPIHICPTVNLYDSVWVVENQTVVGTWAVTARGH